MSFGVSETYIFAYIAFAVVYLVASFAFVVNALRVSTGLSRARQAGVPSPDAPPMRVVAGIIEHSQKLVDYTQMSTVLPLVYIVGSMFLGSWIIRDTGMVRMLNVGWIVFTMVCAVASVALTMLGIRESRAIGAISELPDQLSGRAPEALQKVGLRLGVSAALLLLVTVFTMLNLLSVLGSLDALVDIDYLL